MFDTLDLVEAPLTRQDVENILHNLASSSELDLSRRNLEHINLSFLHLKSALAQPHVTFAGQELYPTLAEKASGLGFSLIKNHPFVDGNKRIAHAALEIFLVLNGYEINATVDEQEKVILQVASSEIGRATFTDWLHHHIIMKHSTSQTGQ
ncbi:MAG: type II toxin-antitoxin system death-on-curing family toxin [Chloroflexota bacterium]|nr:type II toxin-antitoxin system death-on-curing family toxin [Chloroflexota bacterium]